MAPQTGQTLPHSILQRAERPRTTRRGGAAAAPSGGGGDNPRRAPHPLPSHAQTNVEGKLHSTKAVPRGIRRRSPKRHAPPRFRRPAKGRLLASSRASHQRPSPSGCLLQRGPRRLGLKWALFTPPPPSHPISSTSNAIPLDVAIPRGIRRRDTARYTPSRSHLLLAEESLTSFRLRTSVLLPLVVRSRGSGGWG